MRIARFRLEGEAPQYGRVEDDRIVPLSADPIRSAGRMNDGTPLPLADVVLDVPVDAPSKVVCFGRTYGAHVREMGWEEDVEPVMFLKPPSALLPPGGTVLLPPGAGLVEPEPELAVVIGRTGSRIAVADALDHVFGCTVANDVSARDLMITDGQWARAKGFDTFCPLGPWIETDLDPAALRITMRVDGAVVTSATTADLRLRVAELVALASESFTLSPGDVVLTGSPASRTPLRAGMTVRIEIEGIGALENSVADAVPTGPLAAAGRSAR